MTTPNLKGIIFGTILIVSGLPMILGVYLVSRKETVISPV